MVVKMAKDIDWKSEGRMFPIYLHNLHMPGDMIDRLVKISILSNCSVEELVLQYIAESLPDKEDM